LLTYLLKIYIAPRSKKNKGGEFEGDTIKYEMTL